MIKDYDKIKKKKYIARSGHCEVCGEYVPYDLAHLAHRIHKDKSKRIKRKGYNLSDDIYDHELNLAYVCRLKCNSAVLIDKKPLQMESLLKRIKHADKI